MRPVASEDLWTAAPVGRYFVGETFLAWCASPTLAGTAFWGEPATADVELVLRLWAMDARLDHYDSIVDLSRVEGIGPASLERVIDHLRQRGAWYAQRVRRGVTVRPRAAVFPAVVIAGLWTVAAPQHPFAVHDDTAAALAWLERPDVLAVGREVDALVDAAIATSPLLTALRRHLRARLGAASLVGAARALHVSQRTLQRTLRAGHTSFSAEIDRARVEAAQARLRTSDDKIAAIAHAVGCASASHLARVFRRVTGVTPGAYRGGSRPAPR